jgi:glutaconate CoA-transferase subunit B
VNDSSSKEFYTGYRPCDIMICAMSRLIDNDNTVFHGVSSHMPMIATLLAKATHAPYAVHLNIPGGVDPRVTALQKYTSAGSELTHGSVCDFPLSDVFDLSMRGGLDVAFLSGIQFDNKGNVNASVIGDYHKPKVRMPGGAGSAVLIPTVKRAVIWRTKHDKRTFVPKVDFVTTRGNIDKIVTPLCVFKMYKDELILDSIHPTSSIEEVAKNTGFDIRYIDLKYTPLPTEEEMRFLSVIDPQDYRNIEFGQK